MERPAWAPRGIDISVPSVSRIYDYYLGGSHNFEVDREAARKAMEFMPGLPKIMQANRAFMRRAVRYAVTRASPSSSTSARASPPSATSTRWPRAPAREARVVYVDHDPVAVAHSQAVLDGNEHARPWSPPTCASPRRSWTVPRSPRLLDLHQPVALLLVAVLHFVEDADDPYAAVAELRDALAPGSLLILTHASYEGSRSPRSGRSAPSTSTRTSATRWSCARARRSRDSSRGTRWWNPDWCRCRTGGPTPPPSRRTHTPTRVSRGGAQGVMAPSQAAGSAADPDGPEDRLRRFATIWSRAVFPVTATSLTRPSSSSICCRWPGG